jgi:hypothetical protein
VLEFQGVLLFLFAVVAEFQVVLLFETLEVGGFAVGRSR